MSTRSNPGRVIASRIRIRAESSVSRTCSLVLNNLAAVFVKVPVRKQSRLVAVQRAIHRGANLVAAARYVPNSEFIYLSDELMYGAITSDLQICNDVRKDAHARLLSFHDAIAIDLHVVTAL